MELFIVDAIGPFFRGATQHRVNWSKIPFSSLERDGRFDETLTPRIVADFETFCGRAAETGFNAISIDDVAHLADSTAYSASVRALIAGYRKLFARLFAIAEKHRLRVFLTTDAQFCPADAGAELKREARRPSFLAGLTRDLLRSFPAVAGIILRIGESDGLDVRDVFHSTLGVRTPAQCRKLIGALLPACEQMRRDLIVRTWTVGAYRIGDLIWNRDTYRRVFDSFASDRLIVSMKYGETDFFRFLPLNPQFFRGRHRKLIELQARREYEGCGEYPSFTGFDYERYRDELRAGGANLAGIMVWCQTGGWTTFRRLAFLETSAVWNEINTAVTLKIFAEGLSAEDAVADWCRHTGRVGAAYDVLQLLKLSSTVICELLYIDDFAGQKLFFRRLRVPPLLWVFWDQIIVTTAISRALDCFVRDGRRQLRRSESAMAKMERMRELARRAALPEEDIVFERDTFEILAASREYFFLPPSRAREEKLHELAHSYRRAHPDRHYSVRLDFSDSGMKRRTLARIMRLLLRRQRGYRWLDRIITLRLLSWLYPLLRRRASLVPDFAHERAMGIDAVFK